MGLAKKEPRAWGLWGSLAWYVVIYEIASRAYDALETATGFDALAARSIPLHLLDIVASWGKTFLLLALAVRLTGVPMQRYLGWVRPRGREIALGIVATLMVTELVAFLDGSLLAGVEDYRAAVLSGTSLWRYAFQTWPAMVFAPFIEESFFRGFLWFGIQTRLGNRGALLVTSAMFVLIHDNYWYHDGGVDWLIVASFFMLGLTFGWLRWRTGGTVVPMIAHAASNASVGWISVGLSTVLR